MGESAEADWLNCGVPKSGVGSQPANTTPTKVRDPRKPSRVSERDFETSCLRIWRPRRRLVGIGGGFLLFMLLEAGGVSSESKPSAGLAFRRALNSVPVGQRRLSDPSWPCDLRVYSTSTVLYCTVL
jgi:hypothetical protein